MTLRIWRAIQAGPGFLALLALLAASSLHPEGWAHLAFPNASDVRADVAVASPASPTLHASETACPLCIAASRSRAAAPIARPLSPEGSTLRAAGTFGSVPLRIPTTPLLPGLGPRAPPPLA